MGQRLILQDPFNGDVIAYRLAGTAIAKVHFSAGRIGVNYMDVDTHLDLLLEGADCCTCLQVTKPLELTDVANQPIVLIVFTKATKIPTRTQKLISAFVTSYGYLAVFIGTLLEGETVLIAAGFAAHSSLLDWYLVVLVAIAGGTLGDQLAFLLGRWKGDALIDRFPTIAKQKPRIHDLLERYDVIFILTVRFLYGLRITGPLILGSSRVSILRFAVLNVIGAVVWALLVSGAGYTFGSAINTFVGDVKRIEELLLIAILALGIALWLWRRFRTPIQKYESMERRER